MGHFGQMTPLYTRRLSSRIRTEGDVWVFWRCVGRDYLSRLHDLSRGGLFVQTVETKALGLKVNLHFLVPEGQIRADAIVRHAQKGEGIGLKFTAVSDADRPHLAALMSRLRSSRPRR